MKKVIIISNKPGDENKNQISALGGGSVLADSLSIIDLPSEVSSILINNNKISFKAVSWCMFPVIWAGDSLKIEPITPEDLKIGDIVLYKYANWAYAHRLVKKYEKGGELYIVTIGDRGSINGQAGDAGGVSAQNILGKVTEVKRGKAWFRSDDARLRSRSLIIGRLKLSIWTLKYRAKHFICKILMELQGMKLYRCFFSKIIKNQIALFFGQPVIKNIKEVNNFCLYQRFNEIPGDFSDPKGLYNISARINNWSIGNISLFFGADNPSHRICTLLNFIVRIPFRGWGIGYQLLEKALSLCDKVHVEEIRIALSENDKIAIKLFKKIGFEVKQ
ncbi:MAG: GNAT family N-acetyltransferase [Candidatus Omnitrophica bacterium]|nr:GNAT family N-acetyltransferase [Candidatus Omnitrophota bacterium]